VVKEGQVPATELSRFRGGGVAELLQKNGKRSAGGSQENPGKIREIRRTIARILTEQTSRRT
jgi:large subunit ribosomal protein L29